ALGPQAAAHAANAQRATAAEALRKKSIAGRRPPVYTPERSFLFGGLTRALQATRRTSLSRLHRRASGISGIGLRAEGRSDRGGHGKVAAAVEKRRHGPHRTEDLLRLSQPGPADPGTDHCQDSRL